MSKKLDLGELKVKAFAGLRKYINPETSFKFESPTVISSIMENLSLPQNKVTIIFVNGRHANPDDTVSSGDALSFLQSMVVDLISESFRFNFHVNSIHGLCKIIEILTFRGQNFIIPVHNDRRKIFSVLLELFFVVFFMSFILLKTWNNEKIVVGNITIGMTG